MEATAGVASATPARDGSLPMPPSSRKEWRAVAEHHLARNRREEESERTKLGHSDERTIYEQGREPLDVDFCSITMDGTLDNDILQQRIHNVARQREELQQIEMDLRVQMMARSEIMEIQNNFNDQVKEHANAASKLQDQLREKEQTIQELERKLEGKDRELHAIKLDNEAAWAKQDLLREQNKELSTFRRERDHSEAERAQHIKQIHDLQERIQEKERQLIELQEQHRVAQETIMYKDEQMREAQAWVARAREVDVLQSTTNHTLQSELRERTEQYNQLWIGCQRQFAEMERLHLQTIQQLQRELADARERNGTYTDDSRMSQTNSQNNVSQFEQDNGNQFDINGSSTSSGLPNENSDNAPPFSSAGNSSTLNDHVAGVPFAPSLLGVPSYLPPGQMTALHSFVMHQQGVPHSVASHLPQPNVGHFHSVPTMSTFQQWQNQQASSEASQISIQDEPPSSETEQNLMRTDSKFNYVMPVNGQSIHQDYLDAHIRQEEEPQSGISSSTGEGQVYQSVDKDHLVAPQSEKRMQQISSQFRDALRLNSLEQNSEIMEQNVPISTSHRPQLMSEQSISAANVPSSDVIRSVNQNEMVINNSTGVVLTETHGSTGQTDMPTLGKTLDIALLDERSLLACIVRTIPAGGRIRISSTLPNRLGKMLAPLHWHDYKKKYGKLDDFVANHPELFMIEGDYIQLREGAQKMVAATAAFAKVAAAAAASSPYSSFFPTVAVTPMAQSNRLKKVPSIDSKKVKTDAAVVKEYTDDPLKLSMMHNQQANGVRFSPSGGLSNVKILSKSRDSQEMDGFENRPSQSASAIHLSVGNGTNPDRSSMIISQSTGSTNGILGSNFIGKQQGRSTAAYTSRR
ncbi:Reticulocyte-binding 2 a [Quillaja saponaria]|uniref:Reticulocyte-binding 2 a n=1 Tax=Quillaja saponaria TaxID=32244 RepID=A0AAD7LVT8_QUISA|nr:Reticulocyte-binding 2 a [Quillaja saponaria]